MQRSRILLLAVPILFIILIGVVIYRLASHHTETVSGTSDFPAINLLSGEINSDTKSLIGANLQIYTAGKFNPQTAYIVATGYKKTPQADGATKFQFNMVIPEVKSTYTLNFTTDNSGTTSTINLSCAPTDVQPSGSSDCYESQGEEDVSIITKEGTYA